MQVTSQKHSVNLNWATIKNLKKKVKFMDTCNDSSYGVC